MVTSHLKSFKELFMKYCIVIIRKLSKLFLYFFATESYLVYVFVYTMLKASKNEPAIVLRGNPAEINTCNTVWDSFNLACFGTILKSAEWAILRMRKHGNGN